MNVPCINTVLLNSVGKQMLPILLIEAIHFYKTHQVILKAIETEAVVLGRQLKLQ